LPPTATASPTLSAAALAARQTAALWPTVAPATVLPGAIAVESWTEMDTGSAVFLLPPGFEVADLGEFDDVMVMLMEAMAQGMVGMFESLVTPVPGAPPPTPLSFGEAGFELDILMAVHPAGAAAILTGEPREADLDLETALTQAVGMVSGEVTVLAREILIDAPYPTARAVLESRDPETGQVGRQVGYVILSETRLWTIWFSADPLEPMLATFETCALTLRPK
jgi:hypothetical protein